MALPPQPPASRPPTSSPATDAHPQPHPEDDTLLAYMLGRVFEADATALDEHISHCDECAQRLERLELERLANANDTFTRKLQEVRDLTESLGPSNSGPSQQGIAPCEGVATPFQAEESRFQRLQFIAAGGLGQVSEAFDLQLHRKVALKEILPGPSSHHDFRQRFLREARITGNLEHPGIVPVYALGIYPDGRPYYAMRFVRGESLHAAIVALHRTAEATAKQSKVALSALRALLRRFIDVCNAIGYAHERGVLHRDIKPQNIMLGRFGETLVIDWGLAGRWGSQLLVDSDAGGTIDQRLFDDHAETQMGRLMGTLHYMSPEQAQGRFDELAPTSDIFSLGATLYAILTGVAHLEGCDRTEVLQRLHEGRIGHARERNRQIPRALDRICAKAMAATPAGRYQRVQDLAADVQHYLDDEPILAVPESITERLARTMRRNRKTTALSVIFLVGLTVVSLFFASRLQRAALAAQREAHTAQRVTDFLSGLFQADQTVSLGGFPLWRQRTSDANVTLDQLLRRGQVRLTHGLEDEPQVRATLLHTVGTVYSGIGLYQDAGESLEEALALRRAEQPVNDLELAETLQQIGLVRHAQARFEEAREAYEEAISIRSARLGLDAPKLADVLLLKAFLLADSIGTRQQLDQARAAALQAVAIRKRQAAVKPLEYAISLSILAAIHLAAEEIDLAERRIAEAGIYFHDHDPNFDVSQAISKYQQGVKLKKIGANHARTEKGRQSLQEAVECFEQSLESVKSFLGDRHLVLSWVLFDYVDALALLDQFDAAEKSMLELEQIVQFRLGPDHPQSLRLRRQKAIIYCNRGTRREEAEVEMRAVLKTAGDRLGRTSETYANYADDLADLLAIRGKFHEAAEYGEKAYQAAEEAFSSNPTELSFFARRWADWLLLAHAPDAAQTMLQQQINASWFEQCSPIQRMALRCDLGEAYVQMGKIEEAVEQFELCRKLALQHDETDAYWVRRANYLGGACAVSQGRWSEGLEALATHFPQLQHEFTAQELWGQETLNWLRQLPQSAPPPPAPLTRDALTPSIPSDPPSSP